MTSQQMDVEEDIVDNDPVLRLRIVNLDYYLSEPNVGFDDIYSVFRQNTIKRVPVLRVFGITDRGVKTCLHIHRVYPYLSIRFDAKLDDNYEFQKQQFMSQIVKQLESHLMPNKVRTRNNAKESPNEQLIYDIQEINSIPFYGFHDNYQKFLRIYFYNPSTVQKVSELLLSGKIMDKQIQPFEAHIPYTLQFLIDNNLYGMNFLDAKRVEYRKTDALDNNIGYSGVEPMSSCQLECDVDFKDILNRQIDITDQRLPGLEAIWADQLKRCNNSQEVLNIRGVASQERTDIASTNLETYYMKRLFEGLSKLNLKQDVNQNMGSPQLSGSFADETDFAQMMVNCVDDDNESSTSDEISQTIEDVISSSQTLTINQTIEDVIISSQNDIISQTIEEVITDSQKQNKPRIKHKKTIRKAQTIRDLINNPSEQTDQELDNSAKVSDNSCQPIEEETDSPSNPLFVDASTQTELKDSFDDSIDSVFGLGDEIEEIVCDCDSDECCDQCCDQGSDQCECDCERCEFEKCKRIPQLDGAFDSDDSAGSHFSPKYKEDADSDFEVRSKRKRTQKKGKRTKSTRNSPSKRKKTKEVAIDSDDSDVEIGSTSKTSPRRRSTPRKKSTSVESSDDDTFKSSFGRKVKSSKLVSDQLWDKFRPKDAKKARRDGSPIHVSFSESEGSDKEMKFNSYLNIKDFSDSKKSPKKNDDNRSERSLTPYLSHESDEELPSKTKPGPRSSKAVESAKPGPKSSKAGPKSSKTAPKPGPKSSKSRPKPGPLSSKKRDSLTLSSDPENDNFSSSGVGSRSRRAAARAVNYDDTIERSTSFFSEEPTTRKRGQSSGKLKSGKSETESAIDSISAFISPPIEDEVITADKEDDLYDKNEYLNVSSEILVWKSINGELLQIDTEYYGNTTLEPLGNEKLDLKFTPDYIIRPYLRRYKENREYWDQIEADIQNEIKSGVKPKTGTRSKGALKDFYTLPHLNDRKSPERAQNKSKTTASDTKSKANKSKEFARLVAEASHILDKPLSKRGATKSKSAESSSSKTPATKILPKRGSSSSEKSSTAKKATKSNAKSQQSVTTSTRSTRVKRGVTSSTIYNTISIPFYDSDIKVVTELTGAKKRAYLKSLCEEFELGVDKLPKHYLNNYLNHNISPFLFDNIYFNDYSGLLPDEQSNDTQDVLITTKNMINDVVSIFQCVDSVVSNVCTPYEPKPMIDTQEEDYFEESVAADETDNWDYGHYEEEEVGVPVEGVAVDPSTEDMSYECQQKETEEIEVFESASNDPLSEVLTKTFGDKEVDDDKEQEEDHNNQNNKTDEQNDSEVNEYQSDEQNENQQSNDEQNEEPIEQTNDSSSEQNCCSQNGAEDEDQSYDISAQPYSPDIQSNHYSNQTNGHYLEPNPVEYHQQSPYEEEDSTDNSNSSASNQIIEPTEEHHFKLQSEYNPELYGSNVYQSQNMVFQNPIQNPIVPTLMPHSSQNFQTPNVFSGPSSWGMDCPQSIPVQPQYSTMPTLNQTLPTQSDNEFDISTYNYMPYYSNNPNIPQMDGIFDDDDDIQTEGKPFNMRCSSDETIQQLSQGSRSEEASPKKHAADIVAEALRAGNSGIRKKTNACDERYGYYINGVVVKIDKSLPKQCLQQFGRECVPLEPLMNSHTSHRQSIDSKFTREDCNSFFKTRLTGVSKFNYLQSLCNKNIRISLKRLNLSEIQFNYSNINFTNNSFISVSSLLNSNKKFVSLNNNKRLCVETNQSNLKTVVDSKSNASTLNKCLPTDALEIDEIPESPLNEISKCDDMSEDNEIYSFYSDNTLSPNLSQQSSQRSDQSIDEIPESGSSDYNYKQHSTPMNSLKCKPFSQTLTDSQKALDLSTKDSPNSSSKLFSQFSISEEQPIVSEKRAKIFTRNDSLIEGPTPSTTFDYEFSSVTDSPIDSDNEYQYLTTMSVEIHVSTRAKLNPDPKTDAIEVLFYSISCDRPPDPLQRRKYITGLIVVESELDTYECSASFNVIKHKSFNPGFRSVGDIKDICVDFADDEIVLLMKFVEIVKQYDPDIIVGYKIDTLSWGYILERANVLNMSILTPLSRINDEKYSRNMESTQNTKCQLTGRITLNLWSIMRSELTLLQYNYENCHFHVLHERIPNFSFEKLTQLYANRLNRLNRRRVIDYYLRRTVGSLRLLDKLDFIGKTSELSRLFGIQFQEVFNRGTQFRVEGIMLRFTRLMDYIAISPSPRQVATQRAPEILPLILEPESKYYTDPVVVLDFQSLYPSMMIAYNYCYSTCLGKVDQLIGENDFIDFGCFELEMNKRLLFQYQNDIHISPNGVVFLKSNVRKGILPKMLEEILETRVMVKNAMKANNKKQFPNKGLNRKLDARQLGLKLIANVTYGYTNANFSGRMPCVEIADSIVAKGRETLERAINLVHSRPEWGAKVVYGDTDSLFVHFPGLSKDEAFIRGHEIAEAVTQQNPKPVRLKFEKVYFPCVLQTKKRYVGFSYESPEQQTPVFDAKGIETVRRDTCPAVAKMLEKSLRILFTTNECNGVKHYLMRQFQKILNGRISILEDFVFAREYRGADSYSSKSHVPSAEIAKRRLAVDPRNEPKVRERVPYVVIAGPPNEQLFKLIKEPLDLIKDPSLRLNSQYYIEKAIIPALNRVFQLLGHNVNDWYREMPKKIYYQRYHYLLGQESKNERRTIPQFFNTTQCCVCDTNCKGNEFCDSCKQNKDVSITSIADQIRDIQIKYSSVLNSCKQCSASTDSDIQCQSIECPNLFRYHQSRLDLMNAKYLTNVVNKYF